MESHNRCHGRYGIKIKKFKIKIILHLKNEN